MVGTVGYDGNVALAVSQGGKGANGVVAEVLVERSRRGGVDWLAKTAVEGETVSGCDGEFSSVADLLDLRPVDQVGDDFGVLII